MGLTQAALAERIGTTQAAIARLETGSVTPTVRTLCRLADALEVSFEIVPEEGLALRPTQRRPITLSELQARREEILRTASAQGARNVRVFGSVARQDAGPDSDVDILVDLEPGRTLMDLGGLQLDLEELLGRPVHVATLPQRPPSRNEERSVVERIKRDAVAL